MGCDIHMFAEIRDDKERWHPVRQTVVVGGDLLTKSETVVVQDWYNGRNYDEFAILANVRNGYGFAGVDLGDAFEPLAYPKGLPEDCSMDILAEAERWGIDGHSHSWLTLTELIATEDYWNQAHWSRGVVHKEQAALVRETGKPPESWAGGVSGPGSEDYEQVEWIQHYRDCCPYLHHQLIPRLKALTDLWVGQAVGRGLGGAHLTPDDVRITFWFDN